jgi:hypothetical protein
LISHNSNVVRSSLAYSGESAAIGAMQEIAEACFVLKFKSKFVYLLMKQFHILICKLVTLMGALHAKHVTITSGEKQLVHGLYVTIGKKF